MSWPSTDFECMIQDRLDRLEKLARYAVLWFDDYDDESELGHVAEKRLFRAVREYLNAEHGDG